MSKVMTRDEARVYMAQNPGKVVQVSGTKYRMTEAGILEYWHEDRTVWVSQRYNGHPLMGLDSEDYTYTALPDPDELPELPEEIESFIDKRYQGSRQLIEAEKRFAQLLLREARKR